MKRRVSFAFVTLLALLALLVPAPALAMDGHDCSHANHEPTIASLASHVSHAAAQGHIDSAGVTNALLAKLDAAQAAVARGQTKVAANNLAAFIAQVEAQSGKHIDAHHGSHLIMHAEHVIAAL